MITVLPCLGLLLRAFFTCQLRCHQSFFMQSRGGWRCPCRGDEGARVLKWPLTLSGEHLIHTWFIQGEFERDQNRWVQSIDALHFPFKHILFNQRVIFICFYWNNTLQCKVVVSDRWLEFFENCSWDLTLLTMFSHSTVMQNNQTKWPRRVLRESTFTFELRI